MSAHDKFAFAWNHQPFGGDELACPACNAPEDRQNCLGAVLPELVMGDHSIEIYVMQCEKCEQFWIIAYDDFPSA